MNSLGIIQNVLDIILIVFLFFFIVAGWKKGLWQTLGSFISLLAGIIIGVLYSTRLTDFLCTNYHIDETLGPFFEKFIHLPAALTDSNVASMQIENFQNLLGNLTLPNFINELLLDAFSVSNQFGTDLLTALGQSVSALFIQLLVFIAIIVVVTLLLRLLFNKLIYALFPKVLKLVDSLGGLAMGLLKWSLFVFILTLVLVPLRYIIEFLGITSTLMVSLLSLTEKSGLIAVATSILQGLGIL